MRSFEREVLNIEAKEEEKMSNSGIMIPRDTFQLKNYDYSTLNNDVKEEFKDSKWIVLTTPIIQK